ncbi:hypothetical protein RB595_008824 [Gaeumannomyces hyphopodioides]
MDVSVIALGHTDADTPAIVDPAAACLPAAALTASTTPPGHRVLAYSPLSVADLGAADKHISPGANDATATYSNLTTVLYVADVAGYHHHRPAQGGQTHIQAVLASFHAVRAWCRAKGLHMVVLLRGVRAFKDELAAHPLEDCFPGYSWVDDTANAQDLGAPMGLDALVRRMMAEEGAVLGDGAGKQPAVYFHFIEEGQATEKDVDVIVSAVKEIHNKS